MWSVHVSKQAYKHTSIHTHARNEVTLVLMLAPIKFTHKEVVIEMLRDQRLPNFLWSFVINSSFLVLLLYCNKLWIMLL